jgi:hypothetical protein
MVKRLIAIPRYPLPFGSNALSLISLVFHHDGSGTSLLSLFIGSCSKGNQFRLPVVPPFHPALRIDG